MSNFDFCRLAEALEQRGFRQIDLARAAGMTPSDISLLIRGIAVPAWGRLLKLQTGLKALRFSRKEIIGILGSFQNQILKDGGVQNGIRK